MNKMSNNILNLHLLPFSCHMFDSVMFVCLFVLALASLCDCCHGNVTHRGDSLREDESISSLKIKKKDFLRTWSQFYSLSLSIRVKTCEVQKYVETT